MTFNLMTFNEAYLILSNAVRHELRDHAFGDKEVTWKQGKEKRMVATGYFSFSVQEVYVKDLGKDAVFTGKDAVKLSILGPLVVHRNDETGPATFQLGKTMTNLTMEAVGKEICP
jgi:hypothetical protein